jgi:hypothetical protein
VDVVDVVLMANGLVPTPIAMHVHVPEVGDMGLGFDHRIVVHVVVMDAVCMAVVEVVEVIPMMDCRVAAADAVDVRMLVQRLMRFRLGHLCLHVHGRPSMSSFAS